MLKKISPEKVRLLKAEAARRGLSPSEAVEEAIELWLRRSSVVEDSTADDEAWERLRPRLLREARGMYVVIAEGRLVGVYASLEEAARVLRELRHRGLRRAVLVRPGVDDEAGGEGEWLGGALEPA
ncbi:hypothetical protein Pyrde_1950 [Pyrodictium delaneyi]|uniref:Uncharacterized protein n=1 Tax=Pyrodictium delaneyi TaxID=1273541 RepID=A0A0N7JDE8_9CREN|nr:ribbon-helix-helix protein, CopG family [Pyrodictium delaneyi]ALL01993.1 hypothetical protein Pyrde_1950 [Pyrodictium delaneyi]